MKATKECLELAARIVERLDDAGGCLDQPPGYPNRRMLFYQRIVAKEMLAFIEESEERKKSS
jgi:hypothetical protein